MLSYVHAHLYTASQYSSLKLHHVTLSIKDSMSLVLLLVSEYASMKLTDVAV